MCVWLVLLLDLTVCLGGMCALFWCLLPAKVHHAPFDCRNIFLDLYFPLVQAKSVVSAALLWNLHIIGPHEDKELNLVALGLK